MSVLECIRVTESGREWEKEPSAEWWRRCWSSPGRPGWWRGNPTCTSWQVERELCAGWTETWLPCFRRIAPLHHSQQTHHEIKEKNKKRELPTTDLSLCLSLKTARLHWEKKKEALSTPLLLPGSNNCTPFLFLVSSFLPPPPPLLPRQETS